MRGRSRLIRWLAWLIPTEQREFVLGDLEELRRIRREKHGPLRAAGRTLRDLLASAISGRLHGGRGPEPPPTRPKRAFAEDLVQDVSAAVRSIVRDKGFTGVTVLTLALGIGSTAAVFGMVNQLVLRPLPGVADAGSVSYLQFRSREDPESPNGRGIATLDFDELRAAPFVEGAASYGNVQLFVSRGDGPPYAAWGGVIYGDYFELLGARPAEGRLLTAEDNAFGADPFVAVIGQGLRDRLFGPGAEAAGRTIRLNGRSVRILGVTAGGFQGAERTDGHEMWIPYPALSALTGFTDERLLSRNSTMHQDLIVRLTDDRSLERGEERIASVLEAIGHAVPDHGEYLSGLRPTLLPGLTTPPMWRAATQRSLSLLAVIVGLVLLVACMNAANLLLFRNVTRRGSVAVRRALGASSGRIARSQIVQSLILAGIASLAGLAVAWLVTLPLSGESLLRMPAIDRFTVDSRVLGFAVAVAAATTVLFGTVPATLAGRFDLQDALRTAGRGDTGRAAGIRTLLAAGQVGVSLALLVGGAMLTRTVANLYAADTGIAVENVVTMPLSFLDSQDPEERLAAVESALRGVETEPVLEVASASLYNPHGGRLIGRIQRTGEADEQRLDAEMIPVTPEWFEALDVATVDGMALRLDEETWTPGSTVLSASMARRLFGDPAQALGQPVRVGFGEMEDARVVAVTGELRRAYDPAELRDAFFVPFEQAPRLGGATLVVRATSVHESTLESIRQAVERALPDVPVAEAMPLSTRLDQIHSERRVFGKLLAMLSVLALLLAGVGLYGVVAFAVAGRRREFGVRIALGARGTTIAGLVARFAGSIVVTGSILGLLGGYALARTLESRLFGLEPLDPTSYVLAVFLFGLASAIACWIPTRRAVRVDPVRALRTE